MSWNSRSTSAKWRWRAVDVRSLGASGGLAGSGWAPQRRLGRAVGLCDQHASARWLLRVRVQRGGRSSAAFDFRWISAWCFSADSAGRIIEPGAGGQIGHAGLMSLYVRGCARSGGSGHCACARRCCCTWWSASFGSRAQRRLRPALGGEARMAAHVGANGWASFCSGSPGRRPRPAPQWRLARPNGREQTPVGLRPSAIVCGVVVELGAWSRDGARRAALARRRAVC